MRLLSAVRPHGSPGVLAATYAAWAAIVATPFLLPEVVEAHGVSVGAAGLIATFQVGAFAVASLYAGRRIRPSVRVLRVAVALLAVANGLSALAPTFQVLLVMRAAAGLAEGAIVWVAWSEGASQQRRLTEVAAVGPAAAATMAPVLGWMAGLGGDSAVFVTLAVVCAPGLLAPTRLDVPVAPVTGRSRSRSNPILVLALGLLTLSGSALFVYAGAAAQTRIGLGPVVVAWAYSANAVAGMAGARLSPALGGRRVSAGPWLALTGPCAVTVLLVRHPVAFFAAMAVWGFAFFVAVPRVFGLLAARSHTPDERVGDVQSLMAVGRTIGPLVGGALVGDGSYGTLALFSGTGLLAVSGLVTSVEVLRGSSGAREAVGLRREGEAWRLSRPGRGPRPPRRTGPARRPGAPGRAGSSRGRSAR